MESFLNLQIIVYIKLWNKCTQQVLIAIWMRWTDIRIKLQKSCLFINIFNDFMLSVLILSVNIATWSLFVYFKRKVGEVFHGNYFTLKTCQNAAERKLGKGIFFSRIFVASEIWAEVCSHRLLPAKPANYMLDYSNFLVEETNWSWYKKTQNNFAVLSFYIGSLVWSTYFINLAFSNLDFIYFFHIFCL